MSPVPTSSTSSVPAGPTSAVVATTNVTANENPWGPSPRAADGGRAWTRRPPGGGRRRHGPYTPAFAASIVPYLRSFFPPVPDDDCDVIRFDPVNRRWDQGSRPGHPPDANYAGDLAPALLRFTSLEVVVMGGLYDLVTPLNAALYALSRYPTDPARVHWRGYAAGHMAYLGAESRQAMSRDVRQFIARLSV